MPSLHAGAEGDPNVLGNGRGLQGWEASVIFRKPYMQKRRMGNDMEKPSAMRT